MRTKQKFPEGLPGPYEGIVIGHLDPSYMGTLKVELLRKTSAGNEPERSGQLVEARYLSPFYGVTPQSGTTGTYGYQSSQKSYGMWFVPPDVGTRVMVLLLEGNLSQAFWIGCIQDQYMNFMTPGYASTKNIESATGDATGKVGKKVPVAEYNKKREAGTSKNPTRFLKPPHVDYAASLQKQGLIDDDARGTTSSSARREVPSSVFGISTPGPVDKRTSAPKADIGDSASKTTKFINRLGGTSFVMDDGDDKIIRKGHAKDSPPIYENIEALADGETPTGDVTLPANELTRIRTRTGHQILLHNTEDLIYIGNARGTSWIEMTSNGKIDIYAQDSISIHSSNDLNFTADRDINFTSGENVNFVVGKDFKTTTGDSIHNTAGLDINNTAGQGISEIAGTHIANYANLNASYQSVGNTVLGAGADLAMSSGGNSLLESGYHIELNATSNLYLKSADYNRNTKNNSYINVDQISYQISNSFELRGAQSVVIDSDKKVNIGANHFIVNTNDYIELNSDGSFYSLVGNKWQVRSDGETKFYVGGNYKVKADDTIKLWSGNNTEHLVDGDWLVDCNQAAALTSVGKFEISSTNNDNPEDGLQADKGGIRILSGAGIHMMTQGGEGGSGDIKIDSSWGFDIKTQNDFRLNSIKKVSVKSLEDFQIDSAQKILQKAGAEIQLKGSKTELQPNADIAALEAFELDLTAFAPDLPQRDIPNNIYVNPFVDKVKWYAHDKATVFDPGSESRYGFDYTNTLSGLRLPSVFAVQPTPAITADRVARIPMHEPWYQHENLDPTKFTPESTRAGQECLDVYNPELPDTFAPTPTQYDDTKRDESTLFDYGDNYKGGENFSTGAYSAWRQYSKYFPISESLAQSVYAVLQCQYGSFNYSQVESIPNVPAGYNSAERVNLCRQRYHELAERTDAEIQALIDAGDSTFFKNVYGKYTKFGKAIGNTGVGDETTYKGRGPYLGIVGRGLFYKLSDYAQRHTGIPFGAPPTALTNFGKGLILAAFVYTHYKDHGRGTLGNTRIMFFGDEDYELMHKRDELLYTTMFTKVRTRKNSGH